MELLTFMLQAAGAQAGAGASQIIMLVLIFGVFYFFMIRPQMKKQKEVKKFRDALKAGDKVVSAGGIHGKVKEIKDYTVVVEIAEGVKITVDKASVFQVGDAAQPAQR